MNDLIEITVEPNIIEVEVTTATNWNNITDKPAVIAAGATIQEALEQIGLENVTTDITSLQEVTTILNEDITNIKAEQITQNTAIDLRATTQYVNDEIGNVVEYINQGDQTNANAITAENQRATIAEQNISNNLATETTNRIAGDLTNANAIVAETNRAIAVENTKANSADIKSNIDIVFADLTTSTTYTNLAFANRTNVAITYKNPTTATPAFLNFNSSGVATLPVTAVEGFVATIFGATGVLSNYATNVALEKVLDIIPTVEFETLPTDKSAITYPDAYLNTTRLWGLMSTFFNSQSKLYQLKIEAKRAGNIEVAICTGIEANTCNIVFSKTISVSSAGIKTYTPTDLGLPLDIYDRFPTENFFIAITNTTGDTVLTYQTLSVAGFHTTLTGTDFTSSTTFDFSYWIVNQKVQQEYFDKMQLVEELSNYDIIGVDKYRPKIIQPKTWGGSYVDPTVFVVEKTCLFGGSVEFKGISIVANQIGTAIISFVVIENGVADFLHEETKIVSTVGVNFFDVGSFTLPETVTKASKIYVACRNIDRPTEATIEYEDVANFDAYLINNSTGAVLDGKYRFNYFIKVLDKSNPLIDKIKSLSTIVANQTAVDNYDDLLFAINTQKLVNISAGTIIIDGEIELPNDVKIVGSGMGTILQADVGVNRIFVVDDKQNITLRDFKLIGNGAIVDINSTALIPDASSISSKPNIGTGYGVYANLANGLIIEGVNFEKFNHSGFFGTYFGAHPDFDKGVTLNNLNFKDCYVGINMFTRAEYSKLSNITANYCVIGISGISGNVTVVNSSFTKNRVGAFIGAGDNNSHGNFGSCFFNHNSLRAIQSNGITNGHLFTGCQMFDGTIEVINSIGFKWDAGIISGTVLITSSNNAVLSAMIHNTEFRIGIITPSGTPFYSLKNNLFMENPASSSGINN